MIMSIKESREKENPDIKLPIMCNNDSTVSMTLSFSTSMMSVDERRQLNALNDMYIKDGKADPDDESNVLQRKMQNASFTDEQKMAIKKFAMNIRGDEFNPNIICINGPECDFLNVDLSALTDQQISELTDMVDGFM